VPRVKALLDRLSTTHGFTIAGNIGSRLAKRALDDRPLVEAADLAEPDVLQFRVSTVHKVKGESLEAVMYVVNKEHARALLDGTKEELGRIGYVALTRARDLFVLAVPNTAVAELEPDLNYKGFRRAGDVVL
jgi:superfamily I DNA/RNA helicase